MTYIQAIILGIVQGLAEFLPISSSGHLALLQYFFGVESDSVLLFTVMMHVGTLVSVFVIYRKDIWALIRELIATIKDLCTGKGLRINSSPMRRMGFMIIVATIPTALIGLLFEDFFEGLYSSIVAIAIGLIFTGCILLVAEKMGKSSKGQKRSALPHVTPHVRHAYPGTRCRHLHCKQAAWAPQHRNYADLRQGPRRRSQKSRGCYSRNKD